MLGILLVIFIIIGLACGAWAFYCKKRLALARRKQQVEREQLIVIHEMTPEEFEEYVNKLIKAVSEMRKSKWKNVAIIGGKSAPVEVLDLAFISFGR